MHVSLVKLANRLHSGRVKFIPKFETQIQSILSELGMSNAELRVDLSLNQDTISKTGFNQIDFSV